MTGGRRSKWYRFLDNELIEVSVDRSELDGGQAGFGLEQPAEMLGVLKPQVERNLTHGLVGAEELGFGLVDDVPVNVLLRTQSRFLFQEVTEVGAGHSQFLTTALHRWEALSQMLIAFEVRFQHVLEPSGMVLVEVGPREELTVVKPRAIAQQEFDGGQDDSLAVAVEVARVLLFDFVDEVRDRVFLFLRHVQGFVGLVGEKGVLVHRRAQRGLSEKVRMNEQGPAVFSFRWRGALDFHGLSGFHEGHGALLEVVGVATVEELSREA